jgi:chemotaxis protein methyltransferase CheR
LIHPRAVRSSGPAAAGRRAPPARLASVIGPDASPGREFPFSSRDFRYLASLVHTRSGIVLGPHKMDMVYARLVRRLRALGLASFRDYCALIQSREGADEIGALINAITTNLTRFFRESHHFDHLRQVVLRDRRMRQATAAGRRLRIWSAGCSSGEEPYSIAMTLADGNPDLLTQWDTRILATDLDSSSLAKAQAGIYPASAVGELPKSARLRHFTVARGEGWAVAPPLRQLITFKQLNLIGPWPMRGRFDAIFCRNVMIYFDAATKSELMRRFADLLAPDGWLYVGHSESLLDHQACFRLCGRTIYQRAA